MPKIARTQESLGTRKPPEKMEILFFKESTKLGPKFFPSKSIFTSLGSAFGLAPLAKKSLQKVRTLRVTTMKNALLSLFGKLLRVSYPAKVSQLSLVGGKAKPPVSIRPNLSTF